MARCNNCGFRIRGQKHNDGTHHKKKQRNALRKIRNAKTNDQQRKESK